jgi:geranylgeranyl diphosphate synthase type I
MTAESSPSPSIEEMRSAIEAELKNALAWFDQEHCNEIIEMVSYHLGWEPSGMKGEGKRIRPLLVLLCCSACDSDWHIALPAAAAVELIHNFSLVHDDIEDKSVTRRGRPALWTRWGISQAINTGDSIFILSHLMTSRLLKHGLPARLVLDLQYMLDEACLQLVIGQHLDLAFENQHSVSESDYKTMIAGKTSALLAASCAAGARAAKATEETISHLRIFGYHLGLAFQVRDDILGIWGSIEETGKPIGDDLLAHKKTLPIIFGIEHSSEFRQLWLSASADHPEINKMIRVLDQSGAQDYSQKLTDKHTRLALVALRDANPEPASLALLEELALRLLHRHS